MQVQQLQERPLVSIITPTFNHEAYICACIESVLQQSYQNWEQIIVDDGSTDGTADAIGKYSDSRIRHFHQKNAGIEALAHTYNFALGHCRGPIIGILEGDDAWPANKLARMVGAFSDPEVVLAYGEMREIDCQGAVMQRLGRTARQRQRLPHNILCNDPVRSAVPYMLSVPGHSLVEASTVLIRRSALEVIGGFQYVRDQLYVDYPTFILLALRGKFCFFSEVMGYRRMHRSSATAQFFAQMTDRSQKHLSDLLELPEFRLSPGELGKVQRSWRSATAGGEFQQGRLLLFDHKWSEARSHFLKAVQLADVLITAGAVVGWCLSWFHTDLEILFRKSGRPTLERVAR
jgi:glycosyltransferase involved in cell wall biosynthesis